MSQGERITGVKDQDYNLISVLYHTLQEADTLDTYLQDVGRQDDAELRQFLEEVQAENRRRAQRARALLKQRLQ